MRCELCGAYEAEDGIEHDDNCVPCPGMVSPCNNRMWQDEYGCDTTCANYNYAEQMADRNGGRI